MDSIFINPHGLDGNYQRSSGSEYEELRERVINILNELRDGENKPLMDIIPWQQAGTWGLPQQRVGDLVIANAPGYGWVEELTADRAYFGDSLKSGYKQAVIPGNVKGMWTPIIFSGPGVRKNHQLTTPINHVDQYPTIATLIGEAVPEYVQGRVIQEVISP